MSKKGENIYRRKDGRWEARFVRGREPDGGVRYGYCYGRSYREVKEKVNEAKAASNRRVQVSNGGKSVQLGALCDEWLRLKRSQVKESTFVKYQTTLENRIKPELGDHCALSLTSPMVEQFAYGLLHEKGLSAKTVKDVLTVLHAVLLYGEKQVGFSRRIDIAYPKTEKKEMRVLSRAEQEKLTQYLLENTDLCKFGTLFALLTGLRIGEVCALRWRDISLRDGVVYVRSTLQRVKNLDGGGAKTKIIICDPKSFTSARVIPLSPFALELCRRFCGRPDEYILTGKPDKFVEPRVLQNHMKRYAQDCGLSGVHFHTLRHSFATRCVEVGFEIKSLSEVLGHASPQITLDRYVHSSLELKRENMMKLTSIGY